MTAELDIATLSKADTAKLRKEMIKQAKAMLKGSAMTRRQIQFAAREMVEQALDKEMIHGND
jgi:hypothetical protein